LRGLGPPSFGGRLVRAAAHFVRNIGWPVVGLAALGLWPLLRSHRRNHLVLVLVSWFVTHALFVGLAVSAPVEPRFERYADEFVGRVNYSSIPAVAVLAAYGAAWMWSRHLAARAAAAALLAGAAFVGFTGWVSWFR
jgi:hypothetical protein